MQLRKTQSKYLKESKTKIISENEEEIQGLFEKLQSQKIEKKKYDEAQKKLEEKRKTHAAVLIQNIKRHRGWGTTSKIFLGTTQKGAFAFCQKLTRKDGTIIQKEIEILEEQKKFYEELYSDKIQENAHKNWRKEVFAMTDRKLNDWQKELDAEVTEEEIKSIISECKEDKSPGIDGIPYELHKSADFLVRPLLNCFRYYMQKRSLHPNQKYGIITLLPKKPVERDKVENWRPITLLNTDVNILSKILAKRISKTLPSLINEDQTGFVPGRLIFENALDIQTIIQSLQASQTSALAVSVDFRKAFDSVKWNFLSDALRKFGFSEKFIAYCVELHVELGLSMPN